MKRDTIMTKMPISSFLSCEKDTETILYKLFVQSQPYSTILKKLLVVQADDCLTNSAYDDQMKEWSVKRLIDEGYIVLSPKIKQGEHEAAKSRLVLSFNHFTPNATNPEFRDCVIDFDILCPMDEWNLQNYQQRPMKIAGYIDGILNNSRLSGIGTLQFVQGNMLLINAEISGYNLSYWAVHGSDDIIPNEE